MSTLVISLPADEAHWSAVAPISQHACEQSCSVLLGGELVCVVTVKWMQAQPCVPVVAMVDGRHAGPQD
jgi:hypothetical protein